MRSCRLKTERELGRIDLLDGAARCFEIFFASVETRNYTRTSRSYRRVLNVPVAKHVTIGRRSGQPYLADPKRSAAVAALVEVAPSGNHHIALPGLGRPYTRSPEQTVLLHRSGNTALLRPLHPPRTCCSIHLPQHFHQDGHRYRNSFPISCWSKAFCLDHAVSNSGGDQKASSGFNE